MTTNFEFNTDGSFQCILSISGPISSIPAPHQRALSLTVPLCEALYWSFLWNSLPDWARVAPRDSYIPSSPPSTTTMYTFGTVTYHQHQGVQIPSWVTERQSTIIIAPPLPTADLYLNLFCAAGGLREGWWGVGGRSRAQIRSRG